MTRRLLVTLSFVSFVLLAACNPGPHELSGSIIRGSAGVPDNCLVALYEASSVSITTSLPAPVYWTTIDFTGSTASYSIEGIESGSYYFGAFLGVDADTSVSTAEYGSGASYSNPFPLVELTIKKDTVKNLGASDWVGFP
jgi:hypothetical protein